MFANFTIGMIENETRHLLKSVKRKGKFSTLMKPSTC